MKLFHKADRLEIYHGDAGNMDLIKDESVHLVCSSPPYYNARSYSQWKEYDDYIQDMLFVLSECKRVLIPSGRIAINVPLGYGRNATPYIPIGMDITQLMMDVGFTLRGHIIWVKKGMVGAASGTAWGSFMSASNPSIKDIHEIIIVASKGPLGRKKGEDTIDRDTFLKATQSIWEVSPVQSGWHPAPWPYEIARRLIELYTFKGDVVLDPFAGTCTTVHAAKNLGRVGIGIDLNKGYLGRVFGPLERILSDVEVIKPI